MRRQRLPRVDFDRRLRNDNNSLIGDPATEPTLELFKVQWRMPHVLLGEIDMLSVLRALESGRYLSMNFHSWDFYSQSILCYKIQPNIHGLSKRLFSSRSRNTLSLLCKPIERTIYFKHV